VTDAQLGFGDHMQRMRAEQVVILVHRPGKRILDRHDAPGRRAAFDRAEQLHERDAGDEPDNVAVSFECRDMAERSCFALNRDGLRHR